MTDPRSDSKHRPDTDTMQRKMNVAERCGKREEKDECRRAPRGPSDPPDIARLPIRIHRPPYLHGILFFLYFGDCGVRGKGFVVVAVSVVSSSTAGASSLAGAETSVLSMKVEPSKEEKSVLKSPRKLVDSAGVSAIVFASSISK